MKAVIMAGGEGTRLRPISSNRPKPMVRLFDKPVLGHIINLLKKNSVDECCMTLKFLPHAITDYVGEGEEFGIKIISKIESAPLGTAGSVRSCADFIGKNEPVLVISGDCVCDFDLTKCVKAHLENGADATVVLYAHPNPVEYGIVVTDSSGRINRFMEKPAGGRVFTDLINTGIYILSPSVLDLIPEGKNFDFAKDLFPKMLEMGKNLYGVQAGGYWCDIGGCQAYLECAMDLLSGKYTLDDIPHESDGIWLHDPLPDDIKVQPPCYIGKNTVLKTGCTVGPYAILGEGSHISENANVHHCVIDGAHVGERANIGGAVVCKGASIRADATLLEGSVIGESTIIGEDTTVSERVRIWPGKQLPAGSRVTENLVTGMLRSGLRFVGSGIMTGDVIADITPEACFAIGAAAASDGRVGVGFAGGSAANTAALAISCGVCSAGGETVELDGGIAPVASYAADLYKLPCTIFISQEQGRLTLRFFGDKGLAIDRERERKIESALAGGDYARAGADCVGSIKHTAGNCESYTARAVHCGSLSGSHPVKISIGGAGPANNLATKVLSNLNALADQREDGTAELTVSDEGFSLEAIDESGATIDSERMLVILVFTELERGADTIAVPYNSPAIIDRIAESMGKKVLRLGRDKDAEDLFYSQIFLRDGIIAAARLAGIMSLTGESLAQINSRVPTFARVKSEIKVAHSKAAIMRHLQASLAEFSTELVSGIKSSTKLGSVHITPSGARQVIKISGEAQSETEAAALCEKIRCLTEDIDKSI